jgi:adenine-specific DNA-methyltransferase
MPIDRNKLRDLLLQLVPTDGTPIGNGRLRQILGENLGGEVGEEEYAQVRDELVEAGKLLKGQGRGGSVRRAGAEGDGDEADETKAPPPFVLEKSEPKEPAPKATPKKKGAAARPTALRGGSIGEGMQVLSYRHTDRRKNNPEVGMVDPDTDPEQPRTRWAYDPHIDPALKFDVKRGQIETLIDDALASGDQEVMRQALEQLRRQAEPYLEWTGKAERTSFEVDTVSLHVHERIDPASILSAVRKRMKAEKAAQPKLQLGLFSAPFENLPLRDAVDFYKHDKGWSNRLIAGDSLLVMNSLLLKEGMAGQVQMVYIDPPYGVSYGSNFQPFTNRRDVRDRRDEDLTQEPEMIKAFRDTWELGLHSYLTYLRDRFVLARELLAETGSIFVQISDENVHHVRELLDEVFGAENFCSLITFRKKTMPLGSDVTEAVCDYIVWYSKNRQRAKLRPLFRSKEMVGDSQWSHVERPDGMRRRLSSFEVAKDGEQGDSRFQPISLLPAQYRPNQDYVVSYLGRSWPPPKGNCWKTDRMDRVVKARRVWPSGSTLRYVLYHADYPVARLTHLWDDTIAASDMQYVVQTNETVIERCLLMTTDPGDLVFDPTCGSGTTAAVSERWGRRWVTCDTSRVAVTLAKQRLLTTGYEYFELKYPLDGIKGGFIYDTVPHITLGSIANNSEIDEIHERLHPAVTRALDELNKTLRAAPPAPFVVREGGREGKQIDWRAPDSTKMELPSGEAVQANSLLEWEVPFEFPEEWPVSARTAFGAFHEARQHLQREINASIDAHAEQESLYNHPRPAKDKLRITGPFTVEAVPFPSVLALDEARGPAEADAAIARSGETSRQHQWRDELLRTGIRGKASQLLKFAELETLPDTRYLHVSGALAETGERVVVSFGPEYGALEQRQVEMAMREAGELFPRPKMIVFAAFAFDPEAAKDIDQTKGIVALKVQMNTDLLTEDLKKARSSNQSFWLMGQPDIEVRKRKDGLCEVEVNGFDYFDTVKGELVSGGKGKIAMWLLDTDYDERSLVPRQVFFPMAGAKDGWHKLRKDIRAELDEARLSEFHGTVSHPFEPGAQRKIAVKVVDDRGIESLKVIRLD